MSKENAIPVFRAWCERDSEDREGCYVTDGNVNEIFTRLKNGEMYASKIDIETLQMSLDGEKFYSMERVKELIELGEQYGDLMRMKQDQYEAMNS